MAGPHRGRYAHLGLFLCFKGYGVSIKSFNFRSHVRFGMREGEPGIRPGPVNGRVIVDDHSIYTFDGGSPPLRSWSAPGVLCAFPGLRRWWCEWALRCVLTRGVCARFAASKAGHGLLALLPLRLCLDMRARPINGASRWSITSGRVSLERASFLCRRAVAVPGAGTGRYGAEKIF